MCVYIYIIIIYNMCLMIHWNKEFTVYDTKPSLHLNTLAITNPPLCFSASLSQIFWPIWEPASPSSVA